MDYEVYTPDVAPEGLGATRTAWWYGSRGLAAWEEELMGYTGDMPEYLAPRRVRLAYRVAKAIRNLRSK